LAFLISRVCATISLCAVTLALAGCNVQHQGELAANVAATVPVEGATAPVEAATRPAQVTEAEIIDPKVTGIPLPPMRPDFVKLAKEREQAAAAVASAPATTPPEGNTPEGGVTTVAQSYAPAPQQSSPPTGIFSIFSAPSSAVATRVATAPAPASDAPAASGTLLAYERRMTGEDLPAIQAAAQPAASTAFRIAPAAVVEVAGVTRDIRPSMSTAAPALIGPGPQIAGSFGAAGGRNWRPAYDHVATNCFGPDLRAALENIARHFNSEVLVTSGHRTNGRRKSMHRFCRAADIRIVGVSPGTIARYAASVPGINGVGTYRRVGVTHIDTRDNQMAWRH
jgi:hypothetical protein